MSICGSLSGPPADGKQDKPVIKDLCKYLVEKSQINPSLSPLASLLSDGTSAHVGIILMERFINMPSEVVTPMYTMLVNEIKEAVEEKEPYEFSHYLILSKTYTEVASKLDEEENRPQKKGKKQKTEDAATFYFHPEDEALHQHALAYGSYEYSKAGQDGSSDARRTFQELGIRPQGHVVLIEGSKFGDAIKAVGAYLSSA